MPLPVSMIFFFSLVSIEPSLSSPRWFRDDATSKFCQYPHRPVDCLSQVRTCNTTGLPCVGLNYELASCNSTIGCPVDGVWGAWNNYSDCTTSCGVGTQTRTRLCNGQQNGGLSCFGSATQTITCNTSIPCPSETDIPGSSIRF